MNNRKLNASYEKLIKFGYDTAQEECKGGYPDKGGCAWYHGNWMLFRYLGLVSNPYWHEKFYRDAMASALSDGRRRILVAGTADFSMPLLCYEAGITKLDICDICSTPLLICNKAAELLKCEWTTYIEDICQESFYHYDVILNDAFLSRFVDKIAPLRGIASRLQPGGYYITTLKIGKRNKGGEVSGSIRNRFVQKAVNRYKSNFKVCLDIDIEEAAKTYVDRMASYPVTDENEIYKLFHDAGFSILHLEKGDVEGEYEASKYFRILSMKESGF